MNDEELDEPVLYAFSRGDLLALHVLRRILHREVVLVLDFCLLFL